MANLLGVGANGGIISESFKLKNLEIFQRSGLISFCRIPSKFNNVYFIHFWIRNHKVSKYWILTNMERLGSTSQVFLELGSGFSMNRLANKFRRIVEMSFIEFYYWFCGMQNSAVEMLVTCELHLNLFNIVRVSGLDVCVLGPFSYKIMKRNTYKLETRMDYRNILELIFKWSDYECILTFFIMIIYIKKNF